MTGRPLTPIEVLRLYPPHDGTVSGAVASRVSIAPERDCVVCGPRRWSWRAMEARAGRLAGLLRGRGVGVGDRVALMARNSEAHVLLLTATCRIGAILVPTNPALSRAEATHVFGLTEPSLVMHDDTVAPETDAPCLVLNAALDEAVDAAEPVPHAADVTAEATCVIILTSGTTGFPKGVMHSQRSLIACGEGFLQRMHLQPDERMLIVLPLFHVNALFYSVAGALAAGCSMIVVPRFSASGFWPLVRTSGATEVNVIEAMGTILASRPREEFVPHHTLRKAYGVRANSEAVFRNEFGIPDIVVGYGMTEIPGAIANPFDGERRSGSMGLLGSHPDPDRPWTQARVVDESFADVLPGVVGELVVRTPILMQGYWRDPAQTQAAFQDGWFRTGDMVRRDADGYFYFVSRSKDIIRRRGENIAAAEIDRVASAHPGVLEAAAVAVPSELGEDEILLTAVLRTGETLSEIALAAWCARHLAAYKVPRYVLLLPELPHTPTHKIAKATLRSDPTLRDRAVDLHATGSVNVPAS